MTNCILIVNVFPYFSGEVFVENELIYLAKQFDFVYIFSIYGNKMMTPTRKIPYKNIMVFPLGIKNTISKYLKSFVRGLLVKNKKLPLYYELDDIVRIYAKGRAHEIAELITSTIVRKHINIENLTVYSYWFSYQAIAAWMIRKIILQINSKIKIKVVSRAHGYDLYWERNRFNFQPYQDISLKELDIVLPCSQHGRDYLLRKYPWAEGKIVVSQLGTRDHGLSPRGNHKTIVTCCNFVRLKRMPLFAEAFCLLAKLNFNVKWICIGDGTDFEETKSIIFKHNMHDKVEFMGRLTNDEVLKIYKLRHITYFCNISTAEGLPVSIMEAMSFGIPVIATNVGGTCELVNSSNGQLIPVDISSHELKEILTTAINLSEDLYREKCNNARKTWEINCSAEKNYSYFINLIKNRKP